MYPYYNDYQLRIDYDPQNNKYAFQKNVIGPQAWQSISVKDYTDTDANTIYVAKTGSDGNAGTSASPKLTLLAAINACTAAKTKVIVKDSNGYAEELDTMDNDYFEGLYADTAQTPTYTLRVLDFTPADANAIFVKKTGLDANAGTQAAPKLTIAGAIAAVDGTHQAVVIMDSETYAENSIEFTGNFKKLVAARGMTPTFSSGTLTSSIMCTEYVVPSEFEAHGALYISCAVMSDNSFVIAYQDGDDGKGKFVVYNSSGIVRVSTIIFEALPTTYISCAIMSNDNFVIAYQNSANSKFVVYNSAGTVLVAVTVFDTTPANYISCATMSNNNFVIAYQDGDDNKGKFVVYNFIGIEQVSLTIFETGPTTEISCSVMSNDNFVIAYKDSDDAFGKFVIYNSAGVEQVAPTSTGAPGPTYISCAMMSNDNFVIAYSGKFNIYNSAGVEQAAVVNETAAYISCATMSNNNFVIAYVTSDIGKYIVYNSSGVEIIAPTQYNASIVGITTCVTMSNDNFIIAYWNVDGKFTIRTTKYDRIIISTAAIINGIDFTRGDTFNTNYAFNCTAKLTLKWCNVIDYIELDSNDAYAVYSDSEVDIQNCNISDNDIGIYSEENTSTVKNNLVYRNNYGYGVHIKGAAAAPGNINVSHNTIFNNYSGLRLESNNGTNETVKNNIIFDNDIYGINATTQITQSYSISTGTNLNVTNGTSVIAANPLFINDGTLVPANTDLKLKLRVLGYFTDSPAYQLSDDVDPDRDAGAWNVIPIGLAMTWTSETIEKPAEGIGVIYVPVGETQIEKKDGSIETYVDAWREVIELNFVGILNADFTGIQAMLMCGENTMRLYPDPTTYPNNFNTYILIYKELNGAPKAFRLSETGKQDVKLVFSRAFEL